MAAEDPKADRKAGRDDFKKQFELGARTWKKNGGQGAYVPYSLIFGLMGSRGKKKDEPKIEDPPLPPSDGGSGGSDGTTPTDSRPKSNSWPDIVAHYFPKGAGTQYNEGGLVRGGGCAAKGRGRGKIV